MRAVPLLGPRHVCIVCMATLIAVRMHGLLAAMPRGSSRRRVIACTGSWRGRTGAWTARGLKTCCCSAASRRVPPSPWDGCSHSMFPGLKRAHRRPPFAVFASVP